MSGAPPVLPPFWSACLEDLQRDGVLVFDLRSTFADRWLHRLDPVLKALARQLDHFEGDHVPFCPLGVEVHRIALDRSLLTVVERYLGVPPAATAVHYRRDDGPNVTEDIRCWHVDFEDRRVLRMITYLENVDASNGAFQYVPDAFARDTHDLRPQGQGDADSNPNYAPIDDECMRAHVSSAGWRTVTGGLGLTVLADTARLFHRTRPHLAVRKALTTTYTSRSPRFPVLQRNPALDHLLDDVQSSAFYGGSPAIVGDLSRHRWPALRVR